MAESDFYERIEECLRRLFETAGASVYLEIAANSGFSEKLKQAIPHGKEIVFKFLQLRPDIAGFVEEQYMKSLITVEVKEKSLTLEDIYQAKLYKEVFEAKYGFLVTLSPIQEELKRLCKGNFDILRSAADGVYRFLAIARFNNASGEFSDWFEENPFEQPRYWKRCIPVVPSAARDLRGAIFFIDGQARSAAGVGDVDREQPGAVALAAHHFECFAA